VPFIRLLQPLIYRDVGGAGSRVAAFTLDGTICVTK